MIVIGLILQTIDLIISYEAVVSLIETGLSGLFAFTVVALAVQVALYVYAFAWLFDGNMPLKVVMKPIL